MAARARPRRRMALVLAVGSLLGFGPGPAAGASSPSAGLSPGCGSWKVVPTARVGHADLSSIAEVSPTDVWAVGAVHRNSTATDRALIEHWDGADWRQVQGPVLRQNETDLQSVRAVDAAAVWAVGFRAEVKQGSLLYVRTLVERFDGTAWRVVPSPNRGPYSELVDVFAVSPNDLWGVGYWLPTLGGAPQTLVERWDGTAWSIVPSPNASPDDSLDAVSGSSAPDVWAAGLQQASVGSTPEPLIEHFDGTRWTVVAGPAPPAGGYTSGLVGISPDDAWLVGQHSSTGSPLIEHWDGSRWSIDRSANLPSSFSLQNVTARSSTDVWAVGAAGPPEHQAALVEHWDGATWRRVRVPSPNGLRVLRALSISTAGVGWAVGNTPAFSETVCGL